MKKLLLPLVVILLTTACQKEVSTSKLQEEIAGVAAKGPAAKIDVCHYDDETGTWHMINISSNAWTAHKAHGDVRLDDQDKDGYLPNNECGFGKMGDCNDLNPAIYPGVTEICNGIDENCNGQVDENCIQAVTICNQTWMLKNLDVDHYRNGDPIPQVISPAVWATLTSGAWCYYSNNPANGTTYGKLYNWYAVNDPRGIAPIGWHVPSNWELNTLANCLGGSSVAGGKLKEAGTTHWYSPNTGATNSSGFKGLPGGVLDNRGPGWGFYNMGFNAFFWSSTDFAPSFPDFGGSLFLGNYYNDALIDWGRKKNGYSVRCIRD